MISGFQMQVIAQGYLVYEMTNSAKILGIVSTAGAVPVLSLALFGGAIADRIQRKFLVQAGQALSAFISFGVALLIATGTATWVHLLMAAIAHGAMMAFMAPARQALIPQLVERKNIGNAMALNAAAVGVAALIAPAFAGILYSSIGPGGVYILVGLSGLAAFVLTGKIKVGPRPKRVPSHVISDVSAGLSYIWNNRPVKVHLAIILCAVLLATPLISLLPVFVVDVYNGESDAFGLLVSMTGLGSLAGSIVIAGIGPRNRGKIIIGGSLLAGLSLILLGALPWYLIAVPTMVLFGIGISWNINLNQALLVETVDERYRGRVMSFAMMAFGLAPLGVVPAGLAMDVVGAQLVVSLMGMGVIASAVVIFATQKSLRRLQ